MQETKSEIGQNLRYKKNKYSYLTSPIEEKELEVLRVEAERFLDKIALRSCWVCNAAHLHFLNEPWGEWVLLCSDCSRYYYRGVDISTYEEDEDE